MNQHLPLIPKFMQKKRFLKNISFSTISDYQSVYSFFHFDNILKNSTTINHEKLSGLDDKIVIKNKKRLSQFWKNF